MKNNLIPDIVYKEIEFIRDSISFSLNSHRGIGEIDELRRFLNKKNLGDKKISFFFEQENIDSMDYLNHLYPLIDDYNLDCLIVSATSTIYPYSCHPLTALTIWNTNVTIRNFVSWNYSENVDLFPLDKINKNVTDSIKLNKGILSCRKKTERRDRLFSMLPDLNDITVRYAKWKRYGGDESEQDAQRQYEFPSHYQLFDEYNSSIFSFVVESENGLTYTPTSNLTEKTLMAFLTGTMPIILGSCNYLKELEYMGLTTWNHLFDFNDVLPSLSIKKINSYVDCVKAVDDLPFDECLRIWNKNKEAIQKNFDIVYEMVINKENLINKKYIHPKEEIIL